MGIQIYDSEKLVKSETPWSYFFRVWIKGDENSSELHESWRVLLSSKCTSKSIIKFNSEKLVKSETSSCLLARVGLKGGQNRLEHCESWRGCLFI